MSQYQDIRWKQRFNNFDRAFVLLREAMEHGGFVFAVVTPRDVLKRAIGQLHDFMQCEAMR